VIVSVQRIRWATTLVSLAVLLLIGSPWGMALAQEATTPQLAEIPTTGISRPGPIGSLPLAPGAAERAGIAPVAIQIDKAAVDAPIERVDIINGVMQNPTGPWVVSWYQELPGLGSGSNVVMAGHVDYWDVGPAVFWNLKDLRDGDVIGVMGEDQSVFTYRILSMKNYVTADLTPEIIRQEIVGPTKTETLTLITCGGPFDYQRGEYLERMVVRAARMK